MFSTISDNQRIRRVAFASCIGTTIGWYDFFLYNLATILIFKTQFFQGNSKDLMSALLLYGVGFAARPVGGLVCGHFGDKISRKTMLVTTLLVTGIATFLIGVLPPYETIRDWAPIVLVGLRFAQGLSIGGEWGGAVILPVEHSSTNQRGYYASWTQFGVPAGLFLSNAIFLGLVPWLPEKHGWRVPFLLSIVLVGIGLYIRRSLTDAEGFVRTKPSCSKLPLGDVWRHHRKHVLLAMGAKVAENGVFYILTTFILIFASDDYAKYAHYDRNTLFFALSLASVMLIPAILFYGHLSDRIGRKPVYLFGAIFTAAFAFPFFMMVKSGDPNLMTLGIVTGLVLGWAAMYSPQASFFAELFNTRVRYTGMSLAAQVTPVFVGGLAPFISVTLMKLTSSIWPVAVYLIALCVVTIVSVILIPETVKRTLFDDDDGFFDDQMPFTKAPI
jgi:MFS family permease